MGSSERTDQVPLPVGRSVRDVIRCAAATSALLLRRRISLPDGQVGRRMQFADGTSARIYLETVVRDALVTQPCVLIVQFKLRWVRGRAGHAFFRLESLLNTPLFVGFPGFVSKLWLADDEKGRYRGVYEWNRPDLAESYARALWRMLAIVSVADSIRYHVRLAIHRDELLNRPADSRQALDAPEWSQPVAITAAHTT